MKNGKGRKIQKIGKGIAALVPGTVGQFLKSAGQYVFHERPPFCIWHYSMIFFFVQEKKERGGRLTETEMK